MNLYQHGLYALGAVNLSGLAHSLKDMYVQACNDAGSQVVESTMDNIDGLLSAVGAAWERHNDTGSVNTDTDVYAWVKKVAKDTWSDKDACLAHPGIRLLMCQMQELSRDYDIPTDLFGEAYGKCRQECS